MLATYVLSFTKQRLYGASKKRRYPLDRGLGGSQSVWTQWKGAGVVNRIIATQVGW